MAGSFSKEGSSKTIAPVLQVLQPTFGLNRCNGSQKNPPQVHDSQAGEGHGHQRRGEFVTEGVAIEEHGALRVQLFDPGTWVASPLLVFGGGVPVKTATKHMGLGILLSGCLDLLSWMVEAQHIRAKP